MFVYLFFRVQVFIFRLLPYAVIYGLSDFLWFLLYIVIGYRRKVVESNLVRSFPGMSSKERRKVTRRFYRNLTDLLVESIKGFSMSEKQIKKRFVVKNADVFEPYIARKKSVIAVTAHTGNWEWGILSAPFYTKMVSVGLYKPLANKRLDSYLKRNRCRTGSNLTSIYLTAISFERYMNESSLIMMVADQSPSNIRKSFWVNFLGNDTACLHGPEKYAKIYDLPVFYFNVHRFKRGHYEVEFFPISENPRAETDGAITAAYMVKLEEYIRKNPSNWLWSHRRWKHTRK